MGFLKIKQNYHGQNYKVIFGRKRDRWRERERERERERWREREMHAHAGIIYWASGQATMSTYFKFPCPVVVRFWQIPPTPPAKTESQEKKLIKSGFLHLFLKVLWLVIWVDICARSLKHLRPLHSHNEIQQPISSCLSELFATENRAYAR